MKKKKSSQPQKPSEAADKSYSHPSLAEQVPKDNVNSHISEDESIHTAVPATVENDDDEPENEGL